MVVVCLLGLVVLAGLVPVVVYGAGCGVMCVVDLLYVCLLVVWVVLLLLVILVVVVIGGGVFSVLIVLGGAGVFGLVLLLFGGFGGCQKP